MNVYTVQAGDTLESIAKLFLVSVTDLQKWNNGKFPSLYSTTLPMTPGWVINVAPPSRTTYNVSDFGAIGHDITRNDGSVIAGSTSFVSKDGTFKSGDVGTNITVDYAATNTTLSDMLIQGASYSLLTVNPLTTEIASGANVVVQFGTYTQTFVAAATAPVGAIYVTITAQVANYSYPIGSYVDPANLTTTITSVSSPTLITLGADATITAFGLSYTYTPDDTAAIQAAIDAAGAGIVTFPPGVYYISTPLEPPDGCTLVGSGKENTTITVSPSNFINFGYSYMIQGTGTNVTISDLRLDGQKRNGTNPANQCGLLNANIDWIVSRVSFYDPNYFGIWNAGSNNVFLDCESDLGGNNDSIGGGGATNVRFIRHRWQSNLAGNLFDNVTGTNVVLEGCIDDAPTTAGGIYFEGMTQSGIRDSFLTRGGVIQDNSSYSPSTITEPIECFISNNVFNTSNLIAGSSAVILQYQASSGTIQPGGGNRITGNRFINPSGTPIISQTVLGSSCYGGDIIDSNVIINPNEGGTTGGSPEGNTGVITYPQSGIVVATSKTIITNNTCIDNRSTHLMGYGITSGQDIESTDCIVANNILFGSSYTGFGNGDIGLDYAKNWLIVNNATGIGIADYNKTNISRSNLGYNPATVATPSVPAASTTITNDTGVDVNVYVTGGAGGTTSINGTSSGTGNGTFFLPAQGEINLGAYTTAPTWVWIGN